MVGLSTASTLMRGLLEALKSRMLSERGEGLASEANSVDASLYFMEPDMVGIIEGRGGSP